jgi:hypothetical protein
MLLAGGKWLGRDSLYADCATAFQDHLVDFGIDYEMQVLVVSTSAVDVCMSGVGTPASVTESEVSSHLTTETTFEKLTD